MCQCPAQIKDRKSSDTAHAISSTTYLLLSHCTKVTGWEFPCLFQDFALHCSTNSDINMENIYSKSPVFNKIPFTIQIRWRANVARNEFCVFFYILPYKISAPNTSINLCSYLQVSRVWSQLEYQIYVTLNKIQLNTSQNISKDLHINHFSHCSNHFRTMNHSKNVKHTDFCKKGMTICLYPFLDK